MAVTVANIIEAFGDALTTETVAEAKKKRLIALAVTFYSRYNPLIKEATITTVNDQQDYDVEDDCAGVLEVEWWPSGAPLGSMRSGSEVVVLMGGVESRGDLGSLSDKVIYDIRLQTRTDSLTGNWEEILADTGINIRLWPEPSTDGDEVAYHYMASHARTGVEGAETYATIPVDDLEILRDLTLAEFLSGRGLDFALEPDYAEGMQRVTKKHISGNIRAICAELRRGCTEKYGGYICLT